MVKAVVVNLPTGASFDEHISVSNGQSTCTRYRICNLANHVKRCSNVRHSSTGPYKLNLVPRFNVAWYFARENISGDAKLRLRLRISDPQQPPGLLMARPLCYDIRRSIRLDSGAKSRGMGNP